MSNQGRHMSAALRFQQTLRPKHAEEHSSKESGKFYPWEVAMWVQIERTDPRKYETVYYVRASNPGHAAMFAERMWTKWEKIDKGMGHQPFPDVAEEAHVTCLDEGDWKEAWRDARRFHHAFLGMSENPSCFVYWPPDYMKDAGPQLTKESTIIVPAGFHRRGKEENRIIVPR